ncbi:hypothetical protein C8R44DRAFT_818857, partial [Mycena epipterygia]
MSRSRSPPCSSCRSTRRTGPTHSSTPLRTASIRPPIVKLRLALAQPALPDARHARRRAP